MAGRGLLSRVGAARTVRGESSIDAIVEHLNVLLNTRQGECATAPSTYGIPDFTDLAHGARAVETFEQAIRASIREHERRIEIVGFERIDDGDPLLLRFEIQARVVRERTMLRLRTQVKPGGHVRVSR